MSRRLATRMADDRGVYSILYALLVVVLVGMGALVVDLATLREERRTSRSATDAAATAGAVLLNEILGVQPRPACDQAWANLITNLRVSVVPSPCSSLPATASACPAAATVLSGTLGAYTVKITWPVLDTDPLMVHPTVQGGFTQTIDPTVDGDSANDAMAPCTRLGITLTRSRRSTFAGIFGVGSSPVASSSVARGIPQYGNPPVIAALNVLEKHNCDTVTTSGQGYIQINATPPYPGIINVESDGHPSGGSSTCPSNMPYVIDPSANVNNYIRANGVAADGVSQDPGKGFIRQWALSPAGNGSQAFNSTLVPLTISPKPTPLFATFGDKPVRDRYQTYIDVLVSKFNSGGPIPYPNATAPYNTQPFQPIPGPALPAFQCTTQSSDPPIVVPPGNWYVNCPPSGPNDIGLTVGGTVIFQGGTVVLDGGIQTGSQGCLVINRAVTTCPTSIATTPQPTDSILYLRSGDLIKDAQSAMFMPQTFTYIRNGVINMGAGTGTLAWSRPEVADCPAGAGYLDCKYSKFGGLVLWSEGSSKHQLGGQSNLLLRGVLFTPNTHFIYTGQPTQNQTEAQFWTREIEVKGQSGLVMAPDAADGVPTPSSGVALIR